MSTGPKAVRRRRAAGERTVLLPLTPGEGWGEGASAGAATPIRRTLWSRFPRVVAGAAWRPEAPARDVPCGGRSRAGRTAKPSPALLQSVSRDAVVQRWPAAQWRPQRVGHDLPESGVRQILEAGTRPSPGCGRNVGPHGAASAGLAPPASPLLALANLPSAALGPRRRQCVCFLATCGGPSPLSGSAPLDGFSGTTGPRSRSGLGAIRRGQRTFAATVVAPRRTVPSPMSTVSPSSSRSDRPNRVSQGAVLAPASRTNV